jgi:SAM-dependent methyltransferase
MFTSWFRYDFGYSWPFTYGHLLACAVGLGLAALAFRCGWRAWWVAGFAALTVWAFAGTVVMHRVIQINEPVRLPTDAFLANGEGRVLDLGAGSGRAAIGVALARPRARVTAVDLYQGYYGIDDNTPARLMRNAAVAGAERRIDVRTADMRTLPFRDGAFDAAISVTAIDHLRWPDIELALRETARVLKPGGQFLVISLNPDTWVRVAIPLSLHGHGYWGQAQTRERWRTAFDRCGFTVTDVGIAPATLYWLVTRR